VSIQIFGAGVNGAVGYFDNMSLKQLF
jgi:hypothetical protein